MKVLVEFSAMLYILTTSYLYSLIWKEVITEAKLALFYFRLHIKLLFVLLIRKHIKVQVLKHPRGQWLNI